MEVQLSYSAVSAVLTSCSFLPGLDFRSLKLRRVEAEDRRQHRDQMTPDIMSLSSESSIRPHLGPHCLLRELPKNFPKYL